MLNYTAIDDRWINVACIKQSRNHASRRGFPVRSGNRDSALKPHQFCQHLCAPHNRNARLKRCDHFGISALHSSRGNNHRDAFDIFCPLANLDANTARDQPLNAWPLRKIRALHAVAQIVHHLSNAGHANAANSDKVDRANIGSDAFHSRPSRDAPCSRDAP